MVRFGAKKVNTCLPFFYALFFEVRYISTHQLMAISERFESYSTDKLENESF